MIRRRDEQLPALRHLLGSSCGKAEPHAEVLEQFRPIGRWCGASAWADKGEPAAAFGLARGVAVKLSGAEPPAPELRPPKDATHHYNG